MPYVVPSSPLSPTSLAPGSQTIALSPQHQPFALSISLSSPAPVPPQTPTSAFAGWLSRSPPTPSRLATSPSPPSTSSRSASASVPVPRAEKTRRSASASQADAKPTDFMGGQYGRFANAAGGRLPGIPRRVSGGAVSKASASAPPPVASVASAPEAEVSDGSTDVALGPRKRRGRGRSRFTLRSEESSGSDEKEKARALQMDLLAKDGAEAEKAGPEAAGAGALKLEEREARRRVVSDERREAIGEGEGGAGNDEYALEDGSGSGSECTTPTPASIARGHRLRTSTSPGKSVSPLRVAVSEPAVREGDARELQPSVPGIAPRMRRERGLRGRSGLGFDFGFGGEEDGDRVMTEEPAAVGAEQAAPSPAPEEEPEEISTIAFPTVLSPSPVIDVPLSPPVSFSAKRAQAGALYIELPPKSTRAVSGLKEAEADRDVVERHQHQHQHHPKPGPGIGFVPSGASYASPTGPGPEPHSAPLSAPRDSLYVLSPTLSASAPLIRKKSGEILKSSLKSRASSTGRHRPSLSLSSLGSLPFSSPSLSAPATPTAASEGGFDLIAGGTPCSIASATSKMVHFDAQLTQVKHYFVEQKPAAVSRDGSPTLDDTTSGGESGGEWEGFGAFSKSGVDRGYPFPSSRGESDEEARVRRSLSMRVLNMPVPPSLQESAAGRAGDVRLESLRLADDASAVLGVVRVRNIAFEKRVVVRFTFDGWQTTSEVGGKWMESLAPEAPILGSRPGQPPVSYDRFSFAIRLADMLLRIEEKTLVLAVRYNSGGKEMWDNNGGQDYKAMFDKSRPPPPSRSSGSGSEAESDFGKGGSLDRELEKVVQAKANTHDDGDRDASGPSSKKQKDVLASRYDLNTALKDPSPWKPPLGHSSTWNPGRDSPRGAGRATVPFPLPPKIASHIDSPGLRHQLQASQSFNSSLGSPRPYKSHHLQFNSKGLPRGSPRDHDVDAFADMNETNLRLHSHHSRVAESNTAGHNRKASPVRRGSVPMSEQRGTPTTRHHERSYFDDWQKTSSMSNFGYGKARITPPANLSSGRSPNAHLSQRSLSDADASNMLSPQSSLAGTPASDIPPVSSPGRYNSFPPLGPTLGADQRMWTEARVLLPDAGDSETSTPSITSVSSPTISSSPSSPPDFSALSPLVQGDEASSDEASQNENMQFLVDKFCFFNGRGGILDVPSNMRQSRSASSMEDFLSGSPSPVAIDSFRSFKSSSPSMSPRATTPTSFSNYSDGKSGFSAPPTSKLLEV